MLDMKVQQQIAIADPGDWCTYAYAAEQLGVSLRTIARMVSDGRLAGFRPLLGKHESPRHKTILYVPQLREYQRALQVVRRPEPANG